MYIELFSLGVCRFGEVLWEYRLAIASSIMNSCIDVSSAIVLPLALAIIVVIDVNVEYLLCWQYGRRGAWRATLGRRAMLAFMDELDIGSTSTMGRLYFDELGHAVSTAAPAPKDASSAVSALASVPASTPRPFNDPITVFN